MIYVQEKNLKVGKSYFPGIVQSVKVSEAGRLEDKKKGKKTVSNQPAGWEPATVEIELVFEENSTYNLTNMIRFVQKQFKQGNQKKQKKVRLVETQANARGITQVYFNEFNTDKNASSSYATGTLVFVAPKIGGIKVVKTKKQLAKQKKKRAASAKKKKTRKDTSKSPARKQKDRSAAREKAKNVVKK